MKSNLSRWKRNKEVNADGYKEFNLDVVNQIQRRRKKGRPKKVYDFVGSIPYGYLEYTGKWGDYAVYSVKYEVFDERVLAKTLA